ncbi:uncharacterized protein LOC144108594 [Amblyomma americanum]
MESTASTRKPKPFLGVWCTHGKYVDLVINSSFIFSICQKLIAQLRGRDFGGEVSTRYGIDFEDGGDANFKKYVDYIYWVWYFPTIVSYRKNYFKRYPLLSYTHLHLHAFGISHIPLEKVFQTNHMQLFLDTLDGISPEKMVLTIDFAVTYIEMPEILDTTKFDGCNNVTLDSLTTFIQQTIRLIKRVETGRQGMRERDTCLLVQAFVISRLVYATTCLDLESRE